MATAYTSLLGLALPVTGELSGTWGDVVNNYLTSYVDASVAGSQTISGSQTSVTLSTTNGSALTQAGGAGTTGSSQYFIINCTGSPASTLTITAPASSKSYIVINSTSTSQSVVLRGAGPTTGVTIASGDKALVAWNGSDFVRVGASAGGSNTQIQYNNGGNLAGSANLTFDGSNVQIGSQGDLRFGDADNSNWVAFQAPATVASNITWTLPSTDGTNGQALVTNGSGTLSFSSVTTSPGGSNTQLQYNNNGAFGGITGFTYNGTTVTFTNPTVTNYTETAYTANSSTAITLALTNGTVQIITLTGNATITMPTAAAGKSFILFLKQDGTGSRTVTWSTVKWPGGTAPTITSTASKQDIYSFFSDGTNWYGITVAQNYTP